MTADSTDMQNVGYFKAATIVEGFVDATIDALRTGVPVSRLPGQSVFASTHVHQVVDVRADQIAALEHARDQAERLAVRARALSLAEEMDEAESLDYAATARKARRDAAEARQKIAELRDMPTNVAPIGEFDALTDVWIPALARLRRSSGRVSQRDYLALKTVVRKYWQVRRDGVWYGRATIMVNTSDGVAELGPIEWPLGRGGKGTQALAVNMPRTRVLSRDSRKTVVARLVATGRIERDAALTACNAPFSELSAVLLHEICGDAYPAWVSDQWRDPTFVQWLVRVYTDPKWAWLGRGKYSELSSLRQHIVNYAAERGEFVLGEAAPDLYAFDLHTVVRLAHDAPAAAGARIRDWRSSIEPVEYTREFATRRYAPVACACGQPATVSTRVPEIPRDLLCACGRMPQGERFGAPATLRFPDEYQALRVPDAECLADVRAQNERRRVALTPMQLQLLSLDGLRSGASAKALRQELNERNGQERLDYGAGLSVALRRLQRQGYVTEDGARPAIWGLTDDGVEYLASR
ncbi:hypothetical protein G6553_01520 [Nocardioides sp. IC4_145]|uniref:hypothetical protein n=1 Tax=Nocardioides sp. IC4_145 TaxID=2714037 RepID=UPI001407DDB2|nr:hypothetical protein [Nocardioides sp. IC4_145]NHC21853.1 hypothetical protein [Nocardioides sp. IC4_145]